ncbi:MAG: hypothetical protein QW706_10195 [Candidatus Nezhaarchaeales archaeon]
MTGRLGFEVSGLFNARFQAKPGITVIVGGSGSYSAEVARTFAVCRGIERIKGSLLSCRDRFAVSFIPGHSDTSCGLRVHHVSLANAEYYSPSEIDYDTAEPVYSALLGYDLEQYGLKLSQSYDNPFMPAVSDVYSKWLAVVMGNIYRIMAQPESMLVVLEHIPGLMDARGQELLMKIARMFAESHAVQGRALYAILVSAVKPVAYYDKMYVYKDGVYTAYAPPKSQTVF